MKTTLKIVAAIAVIILLVAALPQGLSQPDQAMRVLSQAGYTQIEITGWRPLMAGKDDTFSTGFRAKSPSGAIVTGAVTSGLLKGSTVRVD
jgi:hypothetical protein